MVSSSTYKWIGVFWKINACFFYAVLNVLVRYLSGGAGGQEKPLDPSQILCIQNFVAYLVVIPHVLHQGLHSLKTEYVKLHSLRVIMGVTGIIFLYYAFKYMPVSQAVALGFLGPIFTVILGWLYLKEPIGVYNSLGVILGILGAYLISRPDRSLAENGTLLLEWCFLLPLASAFCFAIAKILGRELALKKEPVSRITNYLLLFSAPVTLIPALATWVWPSPIQWMWLLLLGLVGWVGHYSFAKSYRYAGIVFLMPFGFSRLLISALLAYILFSETPKYIGTFWWGCSVVFISTFLICWQEERLKK